MAARHTRQQSHLRREVHQHVNCHQGIEPRSIQTQYRTNIYKTRQDKSQIANRRHNTKLVNRRVQPLKATPQENQTQQKTLELTRQHDFTALIRQSPIDDELEHLLNLRHGEGLISTALNPQVAEDGYELLRRPPTSS